MKWHKTAFLLSERRGQAGKVTSIMSGKRDTEGCKKKERPGTAERENKKL